MGKTYRSEPDYHKIILLITVYAILIDVPSVLDISITYSIVGFIATTLLSRFLLRGGTA